MSGSELDESTGPRAPKPPVTSGAEETLADLVEEIDGETWINPPPRRPSRSARFWLAVVTGLALVVATGAGVAVFMDRTTASPAVATLSRIEAAGDTRVATTEFGESGSVTARWSDSLGEAVLAAKGLPALGPDEVYGIWRIRDGVAVSAGVADDRDGEVSMRLNQRIRPGDVIGLTIEPEDAAAREPSGSYVVAVLAR